METFLDSSWLEQELLPRALDAHKGHMGTLTIVAGNTRYRGAAVLAAMGALRAGAGLVRMSAIEKVCAAVAARLPCVVYNPLPENQEGGIDSKSIPQIAFCDKNRRDAILLGGGMGNSGHTAEIVIAALSGAACPLVLDADALNVIAGHLDSGYCEKARERGLEALKNCKQPRVLTPHIVEMSRLCGKTPGEVSDKQADTAREFARAYNCVIVLKSHVTYIADSTGENVWINRLTGNAGLARGGSGDVLAGIIASLAAQGMEPRTAAAAGVWLHACAADLAVMDSGYAGLSPEDLPLYLTKIWRKLER